MSVSFSVSVLLCCWFSFIDGRLHGNGSNPCSASSLFATEPESFLRAYYAPIEATTYTPGTAHPWRWYRSQHLNDCFHTRLGLNQSQISSINNVLPGGRVYSSDVSTTLMPDVIVIDQTKFDILQGWFTESRYVIHATIFHSHLDDTKMYLVLTRV